MVCMPDVNIIVTSSTERDLRFYDCSAKTFTLKIVITSWEYMVSAPLLSLCSITIAIISGGLEKFVSMV